VDAALRATNVGVEFTAEAAILRAAHHLIREATGLPAPDGRSAWVRSVLYSMEAVRMSITEVLQIAQQLAPR
jgi:hypothetical protein